MTETLGFILIGYLFGSVLFADIFAKLLKKENILKKSKDGNPGTANAFMYGGFWCGFFTLIGDLLKGFLPVFLYCRYADAETAPVFLKAFVLAAPVVGHIFPVFYKFCGGKGIAVTFGCLLGLLPNVMKPLLIFAASFIVFSVILRVKSHFYRTIIAYVTAFLGMMICGCETEVCFGFFIITSVVLFKFHLEKKSTEKREFRAREKIWTH